MTNQISDNLNIQNIPHFTSGLKDFEMSVDENYEIYKVLITNKNNIISILEFLDAPDINEDDDILELFLEQLHYFSSTGRMFNSLMDYLDTYDTKRYLLMKEKIERVERILLNDSLLSFVKSLNNPQFFDTISEVITRYKNFVLSQGYENFLIVFNEQAIKLGL
jgi:hypothetical protein